MALRLLTAGESHGPGLTCIVEGLPAGLALRAEELDIDMATLEPTMSAWKLVYQQRHPEGHEGHRITFPNRYLRQLERQGFRRRRLSYVYHRLPGRAIPRWLQDRASRNVAGMRHNRSVFTALHFRLLGGGDMVYIGQKVRTIEPPSRPAFRQIPTSRLTLTAQDREAWRGCRDRVARAAERVL